MKRFWKKVRIAVLWRLLWVISTAIAYTVRIRTVGMERLDAMLAPGMGGILATWHGHTILPIFLCRHHGLWAIISKSRDGELQNRLVMSRGFKTIRGSTGPQGVRAFLEAAKKIREGAVIAITPDGPRGPAKVVQPGTVLLAERAGCEIVPMGVACERAWRLRSWDRHMVPMPFSRAVVVFGEPIKVEESSSEEGRARWAESVSEALNRADAMAEAELSGKERRDVPAL